MIKHTWRKTSQVWFMSQAYYSA